MCSIYDCKIDMCDLYEPLNNLYVQNLNVSN